MCDKCVTKLAKCDKMVFNLQLFFGFALSTETLSLTLPNRILVKVY